MPNNEETMCPLPWSHLYVSPHGKMSVCCTGSVLDDYNNTTLEQLWNSDSVKKLRLDLLSGKRNSICNSCYKQDDLGIQSMRLGFLKTKQEFVQKIPSMTNPDGSVDEFKLRYMDLRFNNLCNFKCRTCNEGFSSSIASETASNKELKKFYKMSSNVFSKNEDIIKEFKQHLPYIDRIYFAGGEPMMQEEHWSLLEELVNADLTNVELVYSTNCSNLTFKDKSVLDYWPKFKLVMPQLSIDAMGKQAEYWRDGTVWEKVFDNIKTVSEQKYLHWSIHSTISWVNIYSYINLVKLLLETEISVGNNLTVWCLNDRNYYSLQCLPDFKKQEIEIALDELIVFLKQHPKTWKTIINIENIKKFMFDKSLPFTKDDFKKHHLLDKIRKKDFFEYFPEHENMREYMI